MKNILWFILNIFQALFILIFSGLVMTLAIFFGLVGFRKGMFWIANKLWSPTLLFIVGGKVEVIHIEKQDTTTPNIYAANHSSHFDIPVLFSVSRVNFHFMAKKELKKIPIFGWVNTLVGTIWIDRKNREKSMQSIKKAGEYVKNGKNVITFPEGSRSKNGKINMFRKGSFILAQTGEIDIIPVCVINSAPLNQPGKFGFRPANVKVIFGDKIDVSMFKNKSPEELANYTHNCVKEMHKMHS